MLFLAPGHQHNPGSQNSIKSIKQSNKLSALPPDINTPLTELLDIRYPIILAPMYLVSNVLMVVEATKAGITGAKPALNYRTDKD